MASSLKECIVCLPPSKKNILSTIVSNTYGKMQVASIFGLPIPINQGIKYLI